MAIEIGTVKVPMLIAISAGNPALEVASVVTEMTLSITGEPRPIGARSTTVQPVTGDLRASIARALREAADEIEQDDTRYREHLYLDR